MIFFKILYILLKIVYPTPSLRVCHCALKKKKQKKTSPVTTLTSETITSKGEINPTEQKRHIRTRGAFGGICGELSPSASCVGPSRHREGRPCRRPGTEVGRALSRAPRDDGILLTLIREEGSSGARPGAAGSCHPHGSCCWMRCPDTTRQSYGRQEHSVSWPAPPVLGRERRAGCPGRGSGGRDRAPEDP